MPSLSAPRARPGAAGASARRPPGFVELATRGPALLARVSTMRPAPLPADLAAPMVWRPGRLRTEPTEPFSLCEQPPELVSRRAAALRDHAAALPAMVAGSDRHLMGRPIKIEGNPLHPASLGSTTPSSQPPSCALRSRPLPQPLQRREQLLGHVSAALLRASAGPAASGGRACACLPARVTSPTLARANRPTASAVPADAAGHCEPADREPDAAPCRLFGRAAGRAATTRRRPISFWPRRRSRGAGRAACNAVRGFAARLGDRRTRMTASMRSSPRRR